MSNIDRDTFQVIAWFELKKRDRMFLANAREPACDELLTNGPDSEIYWINIDRICSKVKTKSWSYTGLAERKEVKRLYRMLKRIKGLKMEGWLFVYA